MTSIHTEIDKSIQQIRKLTYEPYIEKVIGKPTVPVFFVQLLHLLMESYGIPKQRAHVYCVATTLLKMGLDLHENVSLLQERELKKIRARQLYVLAGDYFSSLFYHLMSSHQETEGIQCLAKALSRINEAKMTRYFVSDHEQKQLQSQMIESNLLTALADFFHVEKDLCDLWHRLFPPLLLLHMAEEEYKESNSFSVTNKVQIAWFEAKKAVSELTKGEVKAMLSERITKWATLIKDDPLVKGGF
ncbi:heptaprenyl diphosphate synthase component 1 [Thermoflavimicrobium daqui]|jgi:hypothetical protein|uniref:Heptaprenyl diphosphate synthase n=1 Tax=Thermoflavimicrobium daqui TaxID=2137476 RepID=A0A364K2K8_9BACL|nr:heptaprenyl diphosphate synthase component 1 [Thermoflavimicrobium daqui]RAL22636.1 hypothetical protein DL897_13275 [Thermoflavimicrobium daqui]